MLRATLVVLWPSFLAAAIGVGLVFSLVDPTELVVFGAHVHAPRSAVYTLGFFLLWAICSTASALTFVLARERPASDLPSS